MQESETCVGEDGEDCALVPVGDEDDVLPSERRDAFGAARKRTFLKALTKTGCLRDGARGGRFAADCL